MTEAGPRLCRGVRLGFDRVRGADVLLHPEGVLFPNRTALAVLRHCDGSATVADIVAELRRDFRRVNPDDIVELLDRLSARGLVDAGSAR